MEDIKVIFLDIDGVLNSYDWLYANRKIGQPRSNFDDEALKVLAHIVKLTDAKIVLSSSWRIERENSHHNLEMKRKFDEYKLSIISKTGMSKKNKERGWEIRDWIKDNKHLYNVTSFVIIDDDSYDIINHKKTLLPYFIKTSFKDGLKEEHIPKILHVLNGGKVSLTLIPKKNDPDWLSDKQWFRKHIQNIIDED